MESYKTNTPFQAEAKTEPTFSPNVIDSFHFIFISNIFKVNRFYDGFDSTSIIDFFPCSAFLRDFSLCQDQLSSDASELGTALLCSSRADFVYVAVSRNSIKGSHTIPMLGSWLFNAMCGNEALPT